MTLKDQLATIREGAIQRIPEASRVIMHRAIDDLRASGIVDRVIKVGDRMPAFNLENTSGATVSSADLLAKGPLVVSFFRGKW